MKRVDDLELEEDLAFERRSCRWQQVGQLMLVALVLAAVAGVFGGGPVAHAESADTSGSLRVEYQRLARRQSAGTIVLRVDPSLARAGEIRVRFDREFAEQYDWERSVPEPAGMEHGPDGIIARFGADPGGGPIQIVCRIRANHVGRAGLRVGIVDGPEVTLRPFVFP